MSPELQRLFFFGNPRQILCIITWYYRPFSRGSSARRPSGCQTESRVIVPQHICWCFIKRFYNIQSKRAMDGEIWAFRMQQTPVDKCAFVCGACDPAMKTRHTHVPYPLWLLWKRVCIMIKPSEGDKQELILLLVAQWGCWQPDGLNVLACRYCKSNRRAHYTQTTNSKQTGLHGSQQPGVIF